MLHANKSFVIIVSFVFNILPAVAYFDNDDFLSSDIYAWSDIPFHFNSEWLFINSFEYFDEWFRFSPLVIFFHRNYYP